MARDMIFTSESVTAGHPDKLCDQISDAAIDAFLRQDPSARANIECAVAAGVIFIAARFAADADIDLPTLAREVIAEAGYTDGRFDARKCSILTSFIELPLTAREASISTLDDQLIESRPAGDQANAFGYACRDTPELMPLPITLAHRLAQALDKARKTGLVWLSPDAKTQVSVEYKDGKPCRIHGVAITASTAPALSNSEIEEELRAIIEHALAGAAILMDPDSKVFLNLDAAQFDVDGPARHAGLTGRKNGIDTYGEIARQSSAALSGKDPSRIDRIGAYAARYAAKNIVAAGLADRCEVHLSYAIGQASPLSVSVDTFGCGPLFDAELARRLRRHMDFRRAAIEHRFALRSQPATKKNGRFYRPLAVYGHFGRPDLNLPWEATDLAKALLEPTAEHDD